MDEIIKLGLAKEQRLKDLPAGAIFKWEEQYYIKSDVIKLDIAGVYRKCVCLNDGELVIINDEDKVVSPKKTFIHMENK